MVVKLQDAILKAHYPVARIANPRPQFCFLWYDLCGLFSTGPPFRPINNYPHQILPAQNPSYQISQFLSLILHIQIWNSVWAKFFPTNFLLPTHFYICICNLLFWLLKFHVIYKIIPPKILYYNNLRFVFVILNITKISYTFYQCVNRTQYFPNFVISIYWSIYF